VLRTFIAAIFQFIDQFIFEVNEKSCLHEKRLPGLLLLQLV
jgi:hypothetical protein